MQKKLNNQYRNIYIKCKEGVAHTMLNFPIGVAWKIGEVKLFSYVEKTLKTYVFIAYF